MNAFLTHRIIGAAVEVHKVLGCSLLESIYEEGLCHELELRGLIARRQVELEVIYKGRAIKGLRNRFVSRRWSDRRNQISLEAT